MDDTSLPQDIDSNLKNNQVAQQQKSQEEMLAILSNKAIEAALVFNWTEAIELNKEIVKTTPENVDCLNRLARAYFEIGKYQQAKKIYQQVLELDPYNTIAQKNLKRASSFKKNLEDGEVKEHLQTQAISPASFLEEPGITKAVTLIKVAEPQKLSKLCSGIMVNLVAKNRGISITDQEGHYLGVLPDDTGHLLLRLIKGGNKYQAIIKSVKTNGLTILIREIFRSKKFRNQSSFLDSTSVSTYSSDNISLSYDDSSDDSSDQETDENII